MEILFDEMHFEVLRHLDLSQLLKVSRLNKQHNRYFLNKNFWSIYLKYKTQLEYKGLVYKVGKHGSIELFKILSTPFNNKVMEKLMYERIYYDASIYNNKPIIEYVEHYIEHKARGKFDFCRFMKKAGTNFTKENTNEIFKYLKNGDHMFMSNSWVIRTILLNCHNYDILFKYLNELKIDVRNFIDMDFMENLMTGDYKYGYELFIDIIEEGIIDTDDLRNETFIHECSNKRICDYLFDTELVTFDYETFKNPKEGVPGIPFCEYYIIKLYEEVLNLYKNKRREDEYKFLWMTIIFS